MSEDVKKTFTFSLFKRFFLVQYNRRLSRVWKKISYNTLLAEKILIDKFKHDYPDREWNFYAKLSRLVIHKYFNLASPLNQSFYSDNKDLIDSELSIVEQNELLRSRKARYIEYLKYYFGGTITYLPDDFPNKKEVVNPEIPLLNKSEFESRVKLDFNEYKSVRKDVKKSLEVEKERIRFETAPKIEFTPQGVGIIITLFSILFFISGFIYNQFFFSYFGINLSHFYSVSDYLTSSLNKIYYAILSVGGSLILSYFLFPEFFYGETPKTPSSTIAKLIDNIVFSSLIPFFGLIAILNYFFLKDAKGFYLGLRGFLFFLILRNSAKVLVFFKNPIRSYIILMSLLIFFGNIIFSVAEDIHTILTSDIKDIKEYSVEFDNKLQLNDQNLVLLGSTPNYYIFYDKINFSSHVIPTKKIISLVPISNNNNKGIYKYFIKPFLIATP